jgi:hypothetical protein
MIRVKVYYFQVQKHGWKEGNLAREVRGFALLPKLDSFVQKAALKNEN